MLILHLTLQLDVKEVFSKTANLSGILELDNPISVSEILHKAKIEINEKGAKAAASSGKYYNFSKIS